MKRLVLLFTIFPVLAIAQDLPADINAGKIFLDLVKNWKDLGGLGIGSSFVLLSVWFLKTEMAGEFFKKLKPGIKRLLILVLGQVYSLLFMLKSGVPLMEALMLGLVSSGGAVGIYEALKPLFKKD